MKKDIYKKYFEGKRITMMGLGILGRGLGDALFLAPMAKQIIITDKKSELELQSSIQTLKDKLKPEDFAKIKFVLGEHKEEDFVNADIVMKSPSVPLDSIYIKSARDNNVSIYMSAAILTQIIFENFNNTKVIGITGTRGKSTTTMMICHMLKTAGKRVHLGGNARGVVSLPLLDDIEDGDYLVLELDSWQLQGYGDLHVSPNIAVFTSFLDDHMNYYKNDKVAYFADKANIFKYQHIGDTLIIDSSLEHMIKEYISTNSLTGIKDIRIPSAWRQNMNLIGHHNEKIAGLVNEVGITLGLPYDDIVKGISSFEAVEGRLQYLGVFRFSPTQVLTEGDTSTQKTIHVYNDNNGTTPDAVIVGVNSIHEKYGVPMTLICGGADKTLDLNDMVNIITDKSKVNKLILLSGTGTDKLKTELNKLSFTDYQEFETLRESVDEAMRIQNTKHYSNSTQGESTTHNDQNILLYSPGFASFSQYFKNEYEKNDEFIRCISKYK